MADIDNIKDVNIGSAASFRNTINDNFDAIKGIWSGIYVGNDETEAKRILSLGGLWMVTPADPEE